MTDMAQGSVKQYRMDYAQYLEQKERGKAGLVGNTGAVSAKSSDRKMNTQDNSVTSNNAAAPTLDDVFDKKSYYNPGKVLSRLKKQLEKYEKMLAESEGKTSDYKLQLMNPELASDYPKLMEIQSKLDAEEKNQESILERMLETELELEEMQEDDRQ